MTLTEAQQLKHGDYVYSRHLTNSDGTPQRWRVNGKSIMWKTRPDQIRIPIRRGLYQNSYLTETNIHLFSITEEEINS